MIGRLLSMVGLERRRDDEPKVHPVPMQLQKAWTMLAGYDSAQSDGANATHWTNADDLAPWSANTPDVRRTLRNRSRYEVANHSLVSGMMRTLANHTIGVGPSLRIDSGNRDLDRQIEAAWRNWTKQTRLARKLRTMRRAKCVDGEAFARLVTNRQLPGVTLDLRLIECDQVETPDLKPDDERAIDGIRFDGDGNVTQYTILRHHPGDDRGVGNPIDYETVNADQILHYAHGTRPGEVRGVPELTPALALGAILRRYVLATLLNAENAANISGVLESDAPEGEASQLDPLDAMSIEANTFLTLPDGWKAKNFKAEQPVTGFREFRREIVNDFARCIDMPLNIALASSQEYNFASGRLDHGVYFESIKVERDDITDIILEPLFEAWLSEALLIPGLIDGDVRRDQLRHAWRWPAFQSGDPEKDAKAAVMLRKERLLTLDRYHAERHGSDWERELEQEQREQEYADELGVQILSQAEPTRATAEQDEPEEANA